MQLTRLDRWLKERFIYETHILTLRLPEVELPDGVVVTDIEQNKRGDYRHRITIQDNKLAADMIDLMKEHHIMHAIHVVEGKHWYNQRIAPEGRSFTYMWIFRFLSFVVFCFVGFGIFKLSQNEELRATIKDTIEELKTGM